MNETGTRQAGYSVFGIRPVAEFAGYLVEAPWPRPSVKQKAHDRVVDLLLREASVSALLWNTLLLHGKVLPFRARPRAVCAAPGPTISVYIPWTIKRFPDRLFAMQPRSPAHAAFGLAIRGLREERGVSQEAFALRCEIDRSHYSGIERGERNPSLGTIFKVASALGVSASEIHSRAERILSRPR
jgi:DNA-binding XRE family transcriptional regulator